MSVQSLILKWITVPRSNDTKQQQAVQLWEVRWMSRHGEYSSDVKPQVECFTNRQDAENFAQALIKAFALTKTTSGNRVTVARAA